MDVKANVDIVTDKLDQLKSIKVALEVKADEIALTVEVQVSTEEQQKKQKMLEDKIAMLEAKISQLEALLSGVTPNQLCGTRPSASGPLEDPITAFINAHPQINYELYTAPGQPIGSQAGQLQINIVTQGQFMFTGQLERRGVGVALVGTVAADLTMNNSSTATFDLGSFGQQQATMEQSLSGLQVSAPLEDKLGVMPNKLGMNINPMDFQVTASVAFNFQFDMSMMNPAQLEEFSAQMATVGATVQPGMVSYNMGSMDYAKITIPRISAGLYTTEQGFVDLSSSGPFNVVLNPTVGDKLSQLFPAITRAATAAINVAPEATNVNVGVQASGGDTNVGVGVQTGGGNSNVNVGVQTSGGNSNVNVGVQTGGGDTNVGVGVQTSGGDTNVGVGVQTGAGELPPVEQPPIEQPVEEPLPAVESEMPAPDTQVGIGVQTDDAQLGVDLQESGDQTQLAVGAQTEDAQFGLEYQEDGDQAQLQTGYQTEDSQVGVNIQSEGNAQVGVNVQTGDSQFGVDYQKDGDNTQVQAGLETEDTQIGVGYQSDGENTQLGVGLQTDETQVEAGVGIEGGAGELPPVEQPPIEQPVEQMPVAEPAPQPVAMSGGEYESFIDVPAGAEVHANFISKESSAPQKLVIHDGQTLHEMAEKGSIVVTNPINDISKFKIQILSGKGFTPSKLRPDDQGNNTWVFHSEDWKDTDFNDYVVEIKVVEAVMPAVESEMPAPDTQVGIGVQTDDAQLGVDLQESGDQTQLAVGAQTEDAQFGLEYQEDGDQAQLQTGYQTEDSQVGVNIQSEGNAQVGVNVQTGDSQFGVDYQKDGDNTQVQAGLETEDSQIGVGYQSDGENTQLGVGLQTDETQVEAGVGIEGGAGELPPVEQMPVAEPAPQPVAMSGGEFECFLDVAPGGEVQAKFVSKNAGYLQKLTVHDGQKEHSMEEKGSISVINETGAPSQFKIQLLHSSNGGKNYNPSKVRRTQQGPDTWLLEAEDIVGAGSDNDYNDYVVEVTVIQPAMPVLEAEPAMPEPNTGVNVGVGVQSEGGNVDVGVGVQSEGGNVDVGVGVQSEGGNVDVGVGVQSDGGNVDVGVGVQAGGLPPMEEEPLLAPEPAPVAMSGGEFECFLDVAPGGEVQAKFVSKRAGYLQKLTVHDGQKLHEMEEKGNISVTNNTGAPSQFKIQLLHSSNGGKNYNPSKVRRTQQGPDTWLLEAEDIVGANSDNDYDDYVIEVTVIQPAMPVLEAEPAMPEPNTGVNVGVGVQSEGGNVDVGVGVQSGGGNVDVGVGVNVGAGEMPPVDYGMPGDLEQPLPAAGYDAYGADPYAAGGGEYGAPNQLDMNMDMNASAEGGNVDMGMGLDMNMGSGYDAYGADPYAAGGGYDMNPAVDPYAAGGGEYGAPNQLDMNMDMNASVGGGNVDMGMGLDMNMGGGEYGAPNQLDMNMDMNASAGGGNVDMNMGLDVNMGGGDGQQQPGKGKGKGRKGKGRKGMGRGRKGMGRGRKGMGRGRGQQQPQPQQQPQGMWGQQQQPQQQSMFSQGGGMSMNMFSNSPGSAMKSFSFGPGFPFNFGGGVSMFNW